MTIAVAWTGKAGVAGITFMPGTMGILHVEDS